MAPLIKAPVATFNGSVGGVQFANGEAETDNPAVIAYCEAAGYTVEATKAKEPAGPFDPSKHSVNEVRAYIDGLDDSDPEARDAEFNRVVEAERAGKNRKSFMDSIEGVPAGSVTFSADGSKTTVEVSPDGSFSAVLPGPATTPAE